MGNRYFVSRKNFTPANTTDDVLTLSAATTRRLRVLGVWCNGKGTSAPQGLTVSRVNIVGITGGGAITPTKADHDDQPAAAFSANTTWATQPVIDANGITMSWNAIGGKDQWLATEKTKGVLEARALGQISFRPSTGITPQAMDLTVLVEED